MNKFPRPAIQIGYECERCGIPVTDEERPSHDKWCGEVYFGCACGKTISETIGGKHLFPSGHSEDGPCTSVPFECEKHGPIPQNRILRDSYGHVVDTFCQGCSEQRDA